MSLLGETHIARCERDDICKWKRLAKCETQSVFRALHLAGFAHMNENEGHLVSVDRLDATSATQETSH